MQAILQGAFPLQVMLADGSLKPLDGALRQQVQAVIDDMASKALRCMTLAQKTELGELRGCQGGLGKLMSCRV